MAEKDKRYYWLKLKRDFFKRHDIRIIEKMPNGKDYILFYLKLLCESVDLEGNLRFSDEIPYNEEMLAVITDTNIDIVRSAVKVFSGLKMMEVMDNGTYYMREVEKMIGSESYWAQKKREEREISANTKLALDNVQQMSNESPTCPSKRKSKSIEKDKDKEKECVYIAHTRLDSLLEEYSFSYNLRQGIKQWVSYKEERGEPYSETTLKTLVANIHEWSIRIGDAELVKLIVECITANWKNLVFDRLKNKPLTQEALAIGLRPL